MFEALQDEAEIAAFVDLVRKENVKSYLEIGSKFGGSLWAIGSALPKSSKIVSVDMPGGTRAWGQSIISLRHCKEELTKLGMEVEIILGDSTNEKIIKAVAAHGPFDLILIDANHTMPFIRADWENYSRLGRMIAFHDISWLRAPEWVGTRIDVPEFWEEKKKHFRHEEFKFDKSGKNNGIGVLWRS